MNLDTGTYPFVEIGQQGGVPFFGAHDHNGHIIVL